MTDTPNFGDKEFRGVGYPTPLSIPEETTCRQFILPADGSWQALVMGLMYTLTQSENWQQFEGGITRDEAAERWLAIFESGYDGVGCPPTEVPAPVWDEDSEVDDEADSDTQPWYGYVENPEAPPEELEFKTQVGIWAITGFLAIASFEVAFAPAIAFAAIAPKFALAWQRGDVGEVIKIFVKAAGGEYEQAATVNTGDWTEGDVRDITIVAGEEEEEREFLVMSEEIP